jgi:hypothetical protein
MQKSILSASRLSVLVFSLFVLTQSCKKSSDLEAPAKTDNITELKQAVAASTGYSADKVTYSATAKEFTVDGDGIVSLEDAQARFGNNGAGTASAANGTAQRTYAYVCAPSKRNLKIYIDPATVPATWAAAIDQAIANWNSLGCGITMTKVTSTTLATTFVTGYYNNTTNVIGTSNYPDMLGGAGRRINLNTYYNTLPDAQKIFTATHELGHSIGFTHSNGTYGNLIAGTTDADASSIMNSFALNWVSFTSYDVTAANTIYPK